MIALNAHRMRGASALLLLSTLAGCSSPTATVTGTVTRTDKSPVAGARVMLRSIDDRATPATPRGATNAEGKYSLELLEPGEGIPAGKYAVWIVENRGSLEAMRPRTFLAKYARAETSGLKLEVKPGESTVYDIVLETSK